MKDTLKTDEPSDDDSMDVYAAKRKKKTLKAFNPTIVRLEKLDGGFTVQLDNDGFGCEPTSERPKEKVFEKLPDALAYITEVLG